MFQSCRWLSAWMLILALPNIGLAQTTASPEFRIESQIYAAGSDVPVSQNITLFTRGLVFDFQMSNDVTPTPIEIVMFDERKRELTLLDVKRKLSWKVTDLELLKLIEQLRRETAEHETAAFLVKESFTEDHEWSSDLATLTSKSIRYQVRGKRPEDPSILARYYSFLEHFTRLSASDPKRLPPFSRLKLNQTIKRLGWMPSEVNIEVAANEFFKESFSATSKHVLLMSLSNEDRQRIGYARQCWSQFSECSLREYRNLPAPKSGIRKLALRLPGKTDQDGIQSASDLKSQPVKIR